VEGVILDNKLKCKPKAKFTNKYLIWQAVSQNGEISESFITTGTINSTIYKNECLPRLFRFVDKLGGPAKVLFWADMATSLMRKVSLKHLKSKKIDYVAKADNIPNCPQLRPIEKYWAICKDKYKVLPNESTSISMFKRRWTKISNQVACKSGKNHFQDFTSRLATVGQKGVYSIL